MPETPDPSSRPMSHPDADELLRFAVDASGLAPWQWDIDSRHIYLSPQWAQLIGPEAAGRTWSMADLLDQIHPDDLDRVKGRIEEVLLGFRSRYLVEFRVRSGSRWLWTEGQGLVTRRDDAGRALRMVGANSDISQRRAVHDALMDARAAAEDANRAKSELLANVSHELRTPLNAIIGLTQLLQQSQVDDEQRNFLHLIDSSAVSLLALLNDVLDFSKIEAGRLLFEQERFDVRRWLQEAVAPHAVGAEKKGLQVKLRVAPDVPRTLVGDPARLRQIVSNLLANAVKFTQQGGITVTAWAAPNQDDLGPERLRLTLEVRDSGIGIPPDRQDAIFEAFTQVDASTTRRYGGTGLGLAICAKLAAMMDGDITVTSELGKGSSFRVHVVLSQTEEAGGPLTVPMPAEDIPLTGLRVLLAEDNAVNELLMRRTLGQMGCDVEVAHDGQEALDRWQSAPPFDLILMDVQMPVLSGFDATGRIREHERQHGGHMPIVALTAHAMTGDREKCLAAGMDSYVSKPVGAELLAQAMRDALRTAVPATPPLLADIDLGLLTQPAQEETLPAVAPTDRQSQLLLRLRAAVASRDGERALVTLVDLKRLLEPMDAHGATTLAGSLEFAVRQARWALMERALPLFEAELKRLKVKQAPERAEGDRA
ncbi:MAG: response regulator [Burkholderiaceae bacterium]|nr:response regulator [Burkholderiaceae bacterium]